MTHTNAILELQRQRMLLEIEYFTEKEAFRKLTESRGMARLVKRGDAYYSRSPQPRKPESGACCRAAAQAPLRVFLGLAGGGGGDRMQRLTRRKPWTNC